MIKCANHHYVNQTLYLHSQIDDELVISIMIKKVEYLFPLGVILRCLMDIPDLELFKILSVPETGFVPLTMIQNLQKKKLFTREDCLEYIGSLVKGILRISDQWPVEPKEMALEFIDKYILIHLESPLDKLKLFSFMTRKLMMLKTGLI